MTNIELFADISIILEYVQPYTEEHVETINVLSEFNGDIIITKFCSTKSDHRINNRLRLFDLIFEEISGLQGSFDSEEDKIDHICDVIINYNYLNENTPLGVDEFLKSDLESLRDVLRKKGIEQFLIDIETMDGYADNKREKLSRKVIDRKLEIESNHKMAEAYIDSHVDNQVQAKNLVKSGYWNRSGRNGFVLVTHSSAAHSNKNIIQDIIEGNIGEAPDIHSPIYITKTVDLC